MNYIVQSVLQHLGVDQVNFLNPFEESNNNNNNNNNQDMEKLPITENNSSHNGQLDNFTQSIPASPKRKKTVTFQNKIKVILVPTVAEYHRAGCDLWWGPGDYDIMRESFRSEIETALREDRSLKNNIYLAMTKLYQPASESFSSSDDVESDHAVVVPVDSTKLSTTEPSIKDKQNPNEMSLFDPFKDEKRSSLDTGSNKHNSNLMSTHMKRKEAIFIH